MFDNKVFDFHLENGGKQMKGLKTGVAQSDMYFRMLALVKEEEEVERVKIHSFNNI